MIDVQYRFIKSFIHLVMSRKEGISSAALRCVMMMMIMMMCCKN